MAREEIDRAMKHFGVPEGKEEYLFLLPGFYVGAADGKLDAKETVAIVHGGAIAMEVIGKDVMNVEKVAEFLADKTVQMLQKCQLSDVDILMRAVQAKLSEYPPDKANMIKGMIRVVTIVVASISGRKKWILWGSRIDSDEADMISRIAAYL